MGKRQLVHHKTGKPALTPRGALTEVSKSWHLHFCANRECRITYDDYGCADVATNGRCHRCRGLERPGWDASRDPQPCCVGNCFQVVDAELIVRHRLAGPGPWFKCRTCARCHGWPCNSERKPA